MNYEDLSKLEDGQRIRIDSEGVDGAVFRVSDTEVKDIGLTEIAAVGLVSGSDSFALTCAAHSDGAEFDGEIEVQLDEIEIL